MERRAVVMEILEGGTGRALSDGAVLRMDDDSLRAGDVVLAVARSDGGARVLSVLGAAGTAGAEMARVVAAHALSMEYSPAVLSDVDQILRDPGIHDPTLQDLTHLPFVTIDGEGARDLDQALFIQRAGGGYLVRYAIADASWYVRPGTALFEEALSRGASFYLPGLVVPMLPRPLSEGIVSLGAGEPRRALVLALELDGTARCVRVAFVRARIRSAAALSFDQVQRWYDAPAMSPLGGSPFCESLALLREVGRLRLVEARDRDVVSYQRAEMVVRIGDEGFGFSVVADVRSEVELYNEQISLMANVEGARLMVSHGARAAWRVHPAPSDGRLVALERLIAGIVTSHRLDPAVWRWRRRRSPADHRGIPLADYLARIRAAGGHERIRAAIERAAMVSNVRSTFSPELGPHYGVGAPAYARLTAPMREVVGVHTHAEALAAVGAAGAGGWDDLDLLDRVIAAGNKAREVQRRLTKAANKVVIDHLLGADLAQPEDVRPWRRATVVEVQSARAYVHLDSPPIEIKVYQDDLGERPRVTLGGAVLALDPDTTLRVGAAVDVQVIGYEERSDRWRFDLRVVAEESRSKRRRAAPTGRRAP